ncbi:MAG: hypothetical protein KGL39_57215 [Patescibacteria group bacterium]|nr:hypothetical protein [Patescibacteria group bacterium]
MTGASYITPFISGGRPFLIWVCGASFAWVYCLQPIAEFVLAARGHPMTLPIPDMTQMMPVLLGLLGLGGMRTYEKMTGVNQKHG